MESMEINPAFWKGRRVLVTGHTGFKGAWLSLWLKNMGAEVTGYSIDPPSQPNLFELTRLEKLISSVYGDVRDMDHLQAVIRKGDFNIVFHLAAQSLVRVSYQSPVETYSTNIMGTVNVLEAVRHCPTVKGVIVVTTDKCYENRETLEGYREGDPLGGADPYSSSKGCAELVTFAYRRSFCQADDAPRVASARAGNVIGGGDWALDRLLPDCVRCFQERKSVPIRHPQAVRPWQFVLESLWGYLLLAERLVTDGKAYAQAWNFGPDLVDVRPVSWVTEQFASLWGDSATIEQDTATHPHETTLLMLNCEKAKSQLGWRPRSRLEQALAWTVDWYKTVLAGGDARKLCIEQIRDFTSLETIHER